MKARATAAPFPIAEDQVPSTATVEYEKAKPQVRFRPYADYRPIRYEDIVLGRDVVFLVTSFHHAPENVAAGAPAIETFSYTGMLESRDGDHFQLSYFSMTTSFPSKAGKNILADPGGACRQDMVFDESITFWKMGELYVEQGEMTKNAER
jgi:hypothetical protein